jgi:hypothetical protein
VALEGTIGAIGDEVTFNYDPDNLPWGTAGVPEPRDPAGVWVEFAIFLMFALACGAAAIVLLRTIAIERKREKLL